MKDFLYSVPLTSDAKELIIDSLCGLFRCEFQKKDTSRLAALIYHLTVVALPCERLFLSTGSWLLILRALRWKMLQNDCRVGIDILLHFKLLGVGAAICRRVENVEGETAFTYKQFRFFRCGK